MDQGFDIYAEKEHTTSFDCEEFPVLEQFEKYSDMINVSIPKGFIQTTPYSKGILVKGK